MRMLKVIIRLHPDKQFPVTVLHPATRNNLAELPRCPVVNRFLNISRLKEGEEVVRMVYAEDIKGE